MITVEVRTLWNGQVGVPNQKADEAVKTLQHLCIKHNGGQMILSPDQIKSKRKGVSEWFRDRRETHKVYQLYYYYWKPDVVQASLMGV